MSYGSENCVPSSRGLRSELSSDEGGELGSSMLLDHISTGGACRVETFELTPWLPPLLVEAPESGREETICVVIDEQLSRSKSLPVILQQSFMTSLEDEASRGSSVHISPGGGAPIRQPVTRLGMRDLLALIPVLRINADRESICGTCLVLHAGCRKERAFPIFFWVVERTSERA